MSSDKYAYLSMKRLDASATRLQELAAHSGKVNLFSTDRPLPGCPRRRQPPRMTDSSSGPT